MAVSRSRTTLETTLALTTRAYGPNSKRQEEPYRGAYALT